MKYKGFRLKTFKDFLKLKKPLNNLAAYYDNMETGSTITDKTGKGNTATVQGTTVTDTNYKGQNIKTFNQGSLKLPTGKNVINLLPFKFKGVINNINMHQGITSDSTNWYASSDGQLKKYDSDFNVIASNLNISTLTGNSTHTGDLKYYDGKIYVVTENYTNCTTFSNQKISVFNASDLSFIESHDVSAQSKEVSGITIDSENGIIYVCSYCSTTTIEKYNLSDFSYIGTITTPTITGKQGIDFYNGKLYVSTDTKIYKITTAGTVEETLAVIPTVATEGEGIHVADENNIYLLMGSANSLYKFTRNPDAGKFTIIMWVRTQYLPSGIPNASMRLIETSDDYFSVFYNKTSASALYVKTTSLAGTGTAGTRARILESENLLATNVFQMGAITFDGRYVNLYLNNGKQGANSTFDAGGVITSIFGYELSIGGRSDEPTLQLVGDVGETAIFDEYCMSKQEIINYYNATKSKYI
jgi:hypothetical protein